ncbi:hypothetical protein EHQ81_12645 [Leptospira selangorensis]|uniref:Uncharacterized protein n=1 Tax=Leptospira selangorensis TaxID=2484982 RepID=A0A5F2C6P5_9LEPT|nr:hypothetical protein [Leptospira selangorensis]TGM12735.1 hypothetical protein EHQ81_12645 [Leptospira selangorensis]TGM30796.1 hypothetical protein EHQ82_00485 [Leptospira selangorensis]
MRLPLKLLISKKGTLYIIITLFIILNFDSCGIIYGPKENDDCKAAIAAYSMVLQSNPSASDKQGFESGLIYACSPKE